MKRIALHVIILIMAVVSMVCAGKATVIEEIEYHLSLIHISEPTRLL